MSQITKIYNNYVNPVLKKIPIVSSAVDIVSDAVEIISVTRDKINYKKHYEEERNLNTKLFIELTNIEKMIMTGLTNIDYGNGYDFWKMVDVLESNGYVPAGTGTRLGSGVNDISIDEEKSTVDYTNNQAWQAYVRNPLGKRQVKTITTHTVGKGHVIWSDSHQIQNVIDQVHYNESNRMPLAEREFMNRYVLEGGYCMFLTMLAPYGETLLREIPNSEIYEIACDQNDSNKILGIVRYYNKRIWKLDNLGGTDYLSPGQYYEVPMATYEWIPALDWNNLPPRNTKNSLQDFVIVTSPTLSDRKRGLSDFASHLSWLNRLEKLGIARTVLNILRASIVWLHSVKGDPTEISRLKSAVENQGTPPPGSSKMINMETEKFEAISPNLQASDAMNDTKLVRSFSVIGSGLNEQLMTGDYGNLSFAGGKQAARDLVKNLEEPQAMHEDGEKRMFVRAIKAAVHYGTIRLIKVKVPKYTVNIEQVDVNRFISYKEDINEFISASRKHKIDYLVKKTGTTKKFVTESLNKIESDEFYNDLVGNNVVSICEALSPTVKKENESKLIALEKCIKRENCWRSNRVYYLEVLEIWDDDMKYVLKYVAIKKNGLWLDQNLYMLVQVKYPHIQVEDRLALAQALTLDLQNKVASLQTARQISNYDPNVEEERVDIESKRDGDGAYNDMSEPEPPVMPEKAQVVPKKAPVVTEKPPKPRDPGSPRSRKPEKDYV